MKQILFVCAGNTCRSPMAQAIARKLLVDNAEIESAGIETASGVRATKDAVLVMNERGLDVTGHRSKDVSSLSLRDFDKIFAMTPTIARSLQQRDDLTQDKLEVLDVPDPYGRGVDAYRTCADNIEDMLREVLPVQ